MRTGLSDTFPLLGDPLSGWGFEKERQARLVFAGLCRGELEAPTKQTVFPTFSSTIPFPFALVLFAFFFFTEIDTFPLLYIEWFCDCD